MLLAEASSAICVQRFDGSRISAIHTTYRISLRSSSLREPRYPLLRVVLVNEASALSLMLRFALDEFGLVLVGWIREPTQGPKAPGPPEAALLRFGRHRARKPDRPNNHWFAYWLWIVIDSMILPQVHLRKPCYDFSFL